MSDSAPQSAARPFASRTWFPLLLTLGSLVALVIFWRLRSRWGVNASLIVSISGLGYFLVQTIGRFVLKQWRAGVYALARLGFCAAIFVLALFTVFAFDVADALFGPSEDHFADNLTIPPGLDISEPLPEPPREPGLQDTFQIALMAALTNAATGSANIVPSLPSLTALARDHNTLLTRYLASSAAWRVFEEGGNLCATRRWKIGSMWLWNLHGYYTDFEVGSPSGTNRFQARVTLGLNGKTWLGAGHGATQLVEGSRNEILPLRKENGLDESYCIVRCGRIPVEFYEESDGGERRLTKAAIRELEREFKALLEYGDFDTKLLPQGSTRLGTPALNIYHGMQPGIYEVAAWVNPGEAGVIYLQAFEVTKNFRLSADRLYDSSNERVGWSDNAELFYHNANITIYEGDWGKPYAARFELWFKPDSGKPERKLLEKNFKIEGWQR